MNGKTLKELSGEKIEGLLWDSGSDTKLVEIDEDTYELHAGFGDYSIIIKELFFNEPAKWMVDPLTVTVDFIFQDEVVHSMQDMHETEEELVSAIETGVGNMNQLLIGA